MIFLKVNVVTFSRTLMQCFMLFNRPNKIDAKATEQYSMSIECITNAFKNKIKMNLPSVCSVVGTHYDLGIISFGWLYYKFFVVVIVIHYCHDILGSYILHTCFYAAH